MYSPNYNYLDETRYCIKLNCKNLVYSDSLYCKYHCCPDWSCTGSNDCRDHVCWAKGCKNRIEYFNNSYCKLHTCDESGCGNYLPTVLRKSSDSSVPRLLSYNDYKMKARRSCKKNKMCKCYNCYLETRGPIEDKLCEEQCVCIPCLVKKTVCNPIKRLVVRTLPIILCLIATVVSVPLCYLTENFYVYVVTASVWVGVILVVILELATPKIKLE